jgi:hypothetical protein
VGTFNIAWTFPHRVNAAGGEHVQIQEPESKERIYAHYSYERNFGVVLFVIAVACCNKISADVTCQGGICDNGV